MFGISSFVRANWHGVNEKREIRFADAAKNARHGFFVSRASCH